MTMKLLLLLFVTLLLSALPPTLARHAGLRHEAQEGYVAQEDHHEELLDLEENPFMRKRRRSTQRRTDAMEQHHPMYRSQPFGQQQQGDRRQLVGAHGAHGHEPHDQNENNNTNINNNNSLCTEQIVAVKVSEYNVTYQDWADIQYGQTSIYAAHNMRLKIGTWYWEWIDNIYGTMMIYWNARESLFFGFHNFQEHYPISGGWTRDVECPGGYATFVQWVGDDIRQYKLRVCNGCPAPNGPPSSTRL
jgi:hypothetical protein